MITRKSLANGVETMPEIFFRKIQAAVYIICLFFEVLLIVGKYLIRILEIHLRSHVILNQRYHDPFGSATLSCISKKLVLQIQGNNHPQVHQGIMCLARVLIALAYSLIRIMTIKIHEGLTFLSDPLFSISVVWHKYLPSIDNLLKLSKLYHIHMDELLVINVVDVHDIR